jgi:hypothetical protein
MENRTIMSETVTQEELKEAIEVWAPKFNLIRELWPGASIEESLKLMTVIEQKAGEIKDDKKNAMGFGSYVDNKSKKSKELERKVQANSPFNDGWTREFFSKPTLTRCKPKKNTREF